MFEDGRKALRAWREFTTTASDEINSLAVIWRVPDVDEVPADARSPLWHTCSFSATSTSSTRRSNGSGR